MDATSHGSYISTMKLDRQKLAKTMLAIEGADDEHPFFIVDSPENKTVIWHIHLLYEAKLITEPQQKTGTFVNEYAAGVKEQTNEKRIYCRGLTLAGYDYLEKLQTSNR